MPLQILMLAGLLLAGCGSQLAVMGSRLAKKDRSKSIEYVVPQLTQGGEVITVRGNKLTSKMTAELNGVPLTFSVLDSESGTITLPDTLLEGLNVLSFYDGTERFSRIDLLNSSAKLVTSTLPASDVCRGVYFLNKEGVLSEGEHICDNAAGDGSNILPCVSDGQTLCLTSEAFPAVNKIQVLEARAGERSPALTIAGIPGTMSACASAESGCFIGAYEAGAQTLKAQNASSLTPALIKAGEQIGGINGILIPRPADCATSGATGCVTQAGYPALDKVTMAAETASVDPSFSIAGVTGTMASCSTTAPSSNCFLPAYASGSQDYKAINFDGITNDVIKSGAIIAGVSGILVTNPANCSTDGEAACLSTNAFPSMNKSLASAGKIHSGVTIGGVAGTLNDCTSDNESSCFTTTSFPSADKSAVQGLAGKMRSSLTLAGVTGTMADCGNDGSDCYLASYAAGTSPKKAISFDSITANIIKSGSTIAGVSGSVIPAPLDCHLNGETGCVTVNDFPAVDHSLVNTNKSKVHSSLTIGAVVGTMATCAAAGSTSCLTDSNYPSADQSNFNTNKAKVHSTLTLLGIQGTMLDCAADNSLSCYAVANYPAALASTASAGKANYSSSLVIAGTTGTMSDCTAGSSNCYLSSFVNPGQPLKAVNALGLAATDIKTGIVVGSLTGTLVVGPSDCAADGATNCVAISTFPAMDKVSVDAAKGKILSSQTLGGIAGTMNDCNTDGQTSCLAMSTFPTIDAGNVTTNKAKVRSSLTIGGVTGTLADCAANGSNCFLPSYSAGAQSKRAIDFDSITAAKIRSGVSVAGISGAVVPMPSNCGADGATNCVTISTFPSMNFSTVDTNKAKFTSGATLGGVQGTMADCSIDNETGCVTNSTFPSLDKANLNTNKDRVRTSLTIATVAGTLADCTQNDSNCFVPSYSVLTQPLKAISYDSITPGVVKSGTVLGGVTGDYPSATYQLSPGDAYSDLASATFSSQMSTATTFGWFNAAGDRQTQAGSNNLTASNVISGVDILGISGSVPVLAPWDVRAGVSYGAGSTGKLKLDCRSPASNSTWNIGLPKIATWSASTDKITSAAHGYVDGNIVRISFNSGDDSGMWDGADYYVINKTTNDFQISLTSGGSVFDITGDSDVGSGSVYLKEGSGLAPYKTIDLNNNGGALPVENPWPSPNNLCSGVETVAGDDNVWKDVTTGGCTSGADCRYQDKITRLEWGKPPAQNYTLYAGMAYCDGLVYDGKSDWRLPTAYELRDAHIHQINSAANANWISKSEMENRGLLSSTRVSWDGMRIWVSSFNHGHVWTEYLSTRRYALCVRSDDP